MLRDGPLNGEVSSFSVCTPALIRSTHIIITTLIGVVGAFWYKLALAIPYHAPLTKLQISEILRLLKASLNKPPSCSLFSNILNDHIPFSGYIPGSLAETKNL